MRRFSTRDLAHVEVPHETKAHATAPIRMPDGEIAATLCGFDLRTHPEDTEPLLTTLTTFAELLGLLLASQQRADAAARDAERTGLEALTDPLTGLPNRRAWDRFLSSEERRCGRDGHPVAVIVADLDDLKPINDEHGHAAGDVVLRRAAEAICSVTREGDLAARIGGDEFGIVAVHCDAATSRNSPSEWNAGWPMLESLPPWGRRCACLMQASEARGMQPTARCMFASVGIADLARTPGDHSRSPDWHDIELVEQLRTRCSMSSRMVRFLDNHTAERRPGTAAAAPDGLAVNSSEEHAPASRAAPAAARG